MDPSKLKVVIERPKPTAAKQVKSFIGSVHLHPHFIRSLSTISLRPSMHSAKHPSLRSLWPTVFSVCLFYKSVDSLLRSPSGILCSFQTTERRSGDVISIKIWGPLCAVLLPKTLQNLQTWTLLVWDWVCLIAAKRPPSALAFQMAIQPSLSPPAPRGTFLLLFVFA